MPGRSGVRVHKPFVALCQVRVNGQVEQHTFAYRAHSEHEVRKKAMLKLSVIRVISAMEVDEAEYDLLINSKRFPDGLPTATCASPPQAELTTPELITEVERRLASPYMMDAAVYEAEIRASCKKAGQSLELPNMSKDWASDMAVERASLLRYLRVLRSM